MAFTTYPGSGATLTAATLQALIADLRPLYVRKTADEIVNNSTTLQDDNHLVLAMEANTTYRLGGLLRYTCASTAADMQVGFTIPTGATAVTFGAGGGTNVTGQEGNISVYSPSGAAGSVAAVFYGSNNSAAFPIGISLAGHIRVGATAGNLQLQWAQVSATATDLTMLIDSFIELRKVA